MPTCGISILLTDKSGVGLGAGGLSVGIWVVEGVLDFDEEDPPHATVSTSVRPRITLQIRIHEF
jgi:hypothetical protein